MKVTSTPDSLQDFVTNQAREAEIISTPVPLKEIYKEIIVFIRDRIQISSIIWIALRICNNLELFIMFFPKRTRFLSCTGESCKASGHFLMQYWLTHLLICVTSLDIVWLFMIFQKYLLLESRCKCVIENQHTFLLNSF